MPRSSESRGEIIQWSCPKMVFSMSSMSNCRAARGKAMRSIRSPASVLDVDREVRHVAGFAARRGVKPDLEIVDTQAVQRRE